MEQTTLHKIKSALLKEVDRTFWTQFHQSLPEVLNQLHVHRFTLPADAANEEALRAISKSGLLDFCSDSTSKDVRDALKRLEQGTYGLCLRCGQELTADQLEGDPTVRFCTRCKQ
ncbi:MAG TPA: hypothetical protein VII11_11655 [Bacteroidota bacterium]